MIIIPKKRYVLRLNKGGLQEVMFAAKPRLSLPKDPSNVKALRAGVLTRLAHRIMNQKNQPK